MASTIPVAAKTARVFTAAASLLLFASAVQVRLPAVQAQRSASAEDAKRDVLEKFQAIRPHDEDLAVYGLDWAPSLREAKERAAREHRPVFLIFVTNSFGNIYTGHC